MAAVVRTEKHRTADLIDVSALPPLGLYLRDIWRRREYLVRVPADDLRSKNLDTVLGNIWHLLNPALLISVYYLVFGVLLGTDRGIDNFIAFLAIGVFTYQYTQKSATQGARAIVVNEGLIRSLRFPRAILPMAIVVGETLAHLPALAIMFVVAMASGESFHLSWFLLLLCLLPLQFAFNLGLAFFTARATDSFRDFENILPFAFRLTFYVSGILYSVEHLVQDEVLRSLFALNPIFAFASLARVVVLHEAFNAVHLLSACVWTAVALTVGFWLFRAGEHMYGRG